MLGAAATFAAAALALTACGSGSTDSSSSSSADGDKVTMEFWHNSTTGDGKAFWEATAADYMAANPNVTIEVQAVQNASLPLYLRSLKITAAGRPNRSAAAGRAAYGGRPEKTEILFSPR